MIENKWRKSGFFHDESEPFLSSFLRLMGVLIVFEVIKLLLLESVRGVVVAYVEFMGVLLPLDSIC
jgi:hypothetical protein